MELSDLAIFAAVAKCGGITRAATQVNTVQSNVTTRVQAAGGAHVRYLLLRKQPRRDKQLQ